MIYFLHIHKAGGSTLVNMAMRNGERMFNPHANGNPMDKLRGKLLEFWNYSLPKKEAFLTSKHYSFVANERHLGEEVFLQAKVKYVVVMRHPMDIVLSNYHHLAKTRSLDLDSFLTNNSPSTTNPLIFSFTGGKNKELAIKRAQKFDAVIFLDRYQQDVQIMREVAGWRYLDPDSLRSGTNRNSSAQTELPGSMFEQLKTKMGEDIDFYNQVRAMCDKGRIKGSKSSFGSAAKTLDQWKLRF